VGSPIYHMQMTGPVKNLYDRLFPLADIDFDPHIMYRPRFAPKKMVTIYSQGDPDPATYESYFEYTSGTLFRAFGLELVENIVCTRAWDPAAAEGDVELKVRAYEAGKALAVGK
jgi:multimeric flavodoxin WrbA